MDTAPQITADSPAQVPYARQALPRRRSLRRWVAGSAIVLVLLVAGAAALRSSGVLQYLWKAPVDPSLVYVVKPIDMSVTLTEDGELKPKNSIDVKCELEGQSTILSVVEESKRVKKGDLLVELASDAIQERLDGEEIQFRQSAAAAEAAEQSLALQRSENASTIRKAEIALELAELELQRYVKGDFQREMKAVEIRIKQTLMDIDRLEDEFNKKSELEEKGFVTKTQLDLLGSQLETARMELEQNELQKLILTEYEKLKNETQKQSDVDQAHQELERERQRADSREKQALAKVEEQQAVLAMRTKRVDKLRTQLEKCRIYAPVDGIVQYPGDDSGWRWGNGNRIAAGEKVYESQTLIALPDTSQMLVTTRIHEADRHKVRVGMPCIIKVPAVPDHTFTGHIARIASFADTANRWLNPELKEHTTEVLLEETDAPLSPGDSAEVKILIEEVRGVLAVPVQCVYARGAKSYVFVQRGGRSEYVDVKLDRSTESMVEVTAGLSAGDRVMMHVEDELVATLPAARPVPTRIVPPAAQRRDAQSNRERQDDSEARSDEQRSVEGQTERSSAAGESPTRGARVSAPTSQSSGG